MGGFSFLHLLGMAMNALMLMILAAMFLFALTQYRKIGTPALLVMLSVFVFGFLEILYLVIPNLIARWSASSGFEMWYGLFQLVSGCMRIGAFGLLFAAAFVGRRNDPSFPPQSSSRNPVLDPIAPMADESNPYRPD